MKRTPGPAASAAADAKAAGLRGSHAERFVKILRHAESLFPASDDDYTRAKNAVRDLFDDVPSDDLFDAPKFDLAMRAVADRMGV